MRVAIDDVGRLVVPKPLREELGIRGAAELELTAVDGRIELTVAPVPAHVEVRDGLSVIVADVEMTPLTPDATREAIERTRR